MPKQYPEEFKKQVTAICLAGASFATVSKKYHISLNTLYRWRKEYQRGIRILRKITRPSAANTNAKATSYRLFEFLISLIMYPVVSDLKFWQDYMNNLSNIAFMSCVKP